MSYRDVCSRSTCGFVLGVTAWIAGAGFATAQTPAPASAPSAVTTPAVPPLPNRLNAVLPAWLRVRGEFRERMEGVDNAGFVSGRDDVFWLSRFRFNATMTPSQSLSFQIQVQDARVSQKDVGTTGTPFKAAFDLRMAFADLGASAGQATVRLGRQELAFG